MRVSLCQLNIQYEEKIKNIRSVERFVSEASEVGSDIVFFPEMTFTGFSMNISFTCDKNNESIDAVSNYAEKYGIAIGFGWVKKDGEKAENHYTVVSPKRKLLADYIKIHPFSYSGEDKYFSGGTRLSSFDYCGKTIGICICYDLRFPEIFQALSKKAEVIVVAANWPKRRSDQWTKLLDARAIENQAWIFGVNCFGVQNGLEYSGNSRIVKPVGELCCKIDDVEGLITCEINDEATDFRKEFPVKNDRRIELYRDIL